jgi:hypothetical protein
MSEYIPPTDKEVAEAAEFLADNGMLFRKLNFKSADGTIREFEYLMTDAAYFYDTANDIPNDSAYGFSNMDYRQALRFAAQVLKERQAKVA